MQPASLVFCERSGRWAVAWRTVLGRAGGQCRHRLAETRSLIECREALAATPGVFVAIELTQAGAEGAFDLLAEITTKFRSSAAAVLAQVELAEFEWLARELGAVHFIVSPRELPSLVGIVDRHAARLPPPPELEPTKEIWSRLPWSPKIDDR